MLWSWRDRWSSPKNLGKKHLIWSIYEKSIQDCSFHYESKKNMDVSEQLSAQIMDQVGPAWQSYSCIRMCRRSLSWSANRVSCGVTSLACGPWLLGPICQSLWGGHNCWEFGGDTADVSLQKLKPFCLRHVVLLTQEDHTPSPGAP